jgi:hypothetical protein
VLTRTAHRNVSDWHDETLGNRWAVEWMR